MRALAFILTLSIGLTAANAQQSNDDSNPAIIRYLEQQLSAPNRQIRLRGIDGLLASSARVDEITISDQSGIWLSIKGAEIVWTRSALLRGSVEIDSLKAEEIDLRRRPLPDPSLPTPEAQPFVLPDLPVSVNIDELNVPRLLLGSEFIGQSATLSISGSTSLASGAVRAQFEMQRIDGVGGAFNLIAGYSDESRNLDMLLRLNEPAGGLVADMLAIPGRPSMELGIEGSGPIDDLALDVRLGTDGRERLSGTAQLTARADGALQIRTDILGRLETLVASDFQPFFAGESSISATAVKRRDGGFDLSNLDVETAALSVKGALSVSSAGLLETADLNGSLGDGASQTVLPVPGGNVSLRSGEFSLRFGQGDDGAWHSTLDADNLVAGDVTITSADMRIEGTATDYSKPEQRRVTSNVTATLTGFDSQDPAIRRALGRSIDLELATAWTRGNPFEISRAKVTGNGVDFTARGTLAEFGFNGDVTANVTSLAPFRGLFDRRVSGAVDVRLSGYISPVTGIFDLTANGVSRNLHLDVPYLDRLLSGETTLSGQIIRNEEGLTTRDLSLANSQINLTSDGSVSSTASDFGFDLALADLSRLRNDISGKLSLSGSAKGAGGQIGISTIFRIPEGQLLERDLNDLRANFDGTMNGMSLEGTLRGSGVLEDAPITLFAQLGISPEQKKVENLRLLVGPSQITGNIATSLPQNTLAGELRIGARDISTLAALFLQEASGAVDATLKLQPQEGLGQQVEADARISNLSAGGVTVGAGSLNGVLYDAFNRPGLIGGLEFADVSAFGVTIREGSGTATYSGETTEFDLLATLTNDTTFGLAGDLALDNQTLTTNLNRLGIFQKGAVLGLDEPARLVANGDGLSELSLSLSAGAGTLTARGSITATNDITVEARDLPLAVANAIRPDLAASGTISGTILVSGARDNPDIAFDLRGDALSAAALLEAELPPIDIGLSGTTTDALTNVKAEVTGPNELKSTLSGTHNLATGAFDMDGVLDRFPLLLVDPLVGRPGLRGAVDGTFRLLGTTDDPRVPFKLSASGVTARILQQNAVEPFDATAEGSYYQQRITLPNLQLSGAGGANFSVNGRIPLFDDGLNVYAGGRVPLSFANVALAQSGIRAQGVADLNVNATGSLSNPDTSGQISLSGGTVVIPRANLRLEDLGMTGTFAGQSLRINTATARNSQGGTIAANGAIQLSPGEGFPVDIALTGRDLTYTDGRIATADFSADLAIGGQLARRASLSGRIDVDNVEVTVPNTNPGEESLFVLQVEHRNAPAGVAATLRRADIQGGAKRSSSQGSGIALDLRINAPSRVFVRGRGLDGETGGRLTVNGTARDPSPVGQLNLIRGRIQVLSQRIEMNSGAIVFDGALIPDLMVRARTVTDEVEATIALDGEVVRPKISFSSVPDLPDDEILARIAFGRSLSELSPLQIAQVASAAAEFAGRNELSFFDQVRRATGLDDLDFETTEDGATLVRAGKYIQDNVYSSIEADDQGNSKAVINLDINSQVTARGSVDSDGNTSLGIFFERDY